MTDDKNDNNFKKVQKTKYDSPWTKFIFTEAQVNDDPYAMYKDKIQYQCEQLIGSISKELLNSKQPGNLAYRNVDFANKSAICLVMEQMLALQYEHTPNEQAVMTIELFSHLPGVMDFKIDLIEKIQSNTMCKTTLISKLKQIVKKIINRKKETI